MINHNAKTTLRHAAAALALAAFAPLGQAATPANPADPVAVPPAVRDMAAGIAAELARNCPVVAAGDGAAYDTCRKAMWGESKLRAHLPPVLLWGRQNKNPEATLRQTNLTQFAPDVWTNMYAPLFMFNGKHTVEWVASEKRFLVRLEAAFRNRLAPGQFPYPFWHEEEKWATYEKANGFLLWVDPASTRIAAAQFTSRAANPMLQPVEHVQHKFEGTWMWTDASGRTQPAVTLFDGLYRADNPYLKTMDRQYRDLALQMRESQCTSCHVPNNPDKMSRLVLLSTPAHAAGEVDRLIKSVKEDRMPMDEFRISYPLSAENKKWLLESAEIFKGTVQAAKAWELQAGQKPQAVVAGNQSASPTKEVSK
ncbi:MAG TPA: hypothetical protein VLJ58_00605 [Ramlibacter sp.]|nr:hypothetical protein [Ramlibacter sp.]